MCHSCYDQLHCTIHEFRIYLEYEYDWISIFKFGVYFRGTSLTRAM